MKKINLSLIGIFLFGSLMAQKITTCVDVLDWSETEYTCVNIGAENTKQVKVTSYVKKIKDAEKQLKKDAVFCALFKAMGANESAFCNLQPAPVSEAILNAKKDWFNNFFKEGGKYTDYVSLNSSGFEEEDMGKVSKVRSVCVINYTELRRYLETNSILEKINSDDLPKIMVFPDPQWMVTNKCKGDYPKALENGTMNSAITKLQSVLKTKGLEVVDLANFMTEDITKNALNALQGNTEGTEAALLKIAKPEVKIYVGWKNIPDETGKGKKNINFNVIAFDANTNKPWGNMGNIIIESSGLLDKTIETAILGKIDYPFMYEVNEQHTKVMKTGRSITIRFNKAATSQRAFMTDRSVDGKEFYRLLKDHIKSISKDGKYCKPTTEVDDNLVFDVIINPKYEGEINTASSFSDRISDFLYSKGIECKKTTLGADVSITITN